MLNLDVTVWHDQTGKRNRPHQFGKVFQYSLPFQPVYVSYAKTIVDRWVHCFGKCFQGLIESFTEIIP